MNFVACIKGLFTASVLGLTLLSAGSALAQDATAAAPLAPIEGTWKTLNGAEITVAACPTGFCGTMSWVLIPKAQADICRSIPHADFAQLMVDMRNPDKSQQTRPILGMQMMTIPPSNNPTAYTAKIYNAQDGSTNDINVWIVNNGTTMRIGGGCLGAVCVVTQDWPKVPPRDPSPDFSCEGGE